MIIARKDSTTIERSAVETVTKSVAIQACKEFSDIIADNGIEEYTGGCWRICRDNRDDIVVAWQLLDSLGQANANRRKVGHHMATPFQIKGIVLGGESWKCGSSLRLRR